MVKPSLSLLLPALFITIACAEPAQLPKLPLEDFCRGFAVSNAVISPDGKYIVYQATFEKDTALAVLNLETHKTAALELSKPADPVHHFLNVNFTWLGSQRIVYSSPGMGSGVIDADGTHRTGLLWGGTRVLHSFEGSETGTILATDADYYYPEVWHMSTRELGPRGHYLMNPGDVIGWLSDSAGVVRIGIREVGRVRSVIYRENENGGWGTLHGLENLDVQAGADVLGLTGDGKTLYLSFLTPAKKWSVYAYDIANQRLGDLILSHNHYDIIPWANMAGYEDGIPLQGIVLARTSQRLLGVRYVTSGPHTLWLDPTLAAVQQAVDSALPHRINTIRSFSDDLQKLVILSWTASDPGTYFLFDLEKKSLAPFLPRIPWIRANQMATVNPISFKTHDGTVIEGYLTVPARREPKHLPLIVYPHGGPFDRDILEFDPFVQFLANRGYAVIQVNFRGSVGYGEDFRNSGVGEFGGKVQEDIADGARWAIAQGVADPKRIAILGGSFGGYCVLMGLIQHPELYRCGIDIAGVYDWVALQKLRTKGTAQLSGLINDTGIEEKDEAALQAISPAAQVEKIKAPLLIVHGKEDNIVPYSQSAALMNDLKSRHQPYEVLMRYNELHGFRGYEDVHELYSRIESFLEKNL
jgi:dipeptidyl aminopeptidase/acylaminoacyl peptidase